MIRNFFKTLLGSYLEGRLESQKKAEVVDHLCLLSFGFLFNQPLNRLRPNPARPISPMPTSSMVVGSGMGLGAIHPLPLPLAPMLWT
jgi:hypothetical protein